MRVENTSIYTFVNENIWIKSLVRKISFLKDKLGYYIFQPLCAFDFF